MRKNLLSEKTRNAALAFIGLSSLFQIKPRSVQRYYQGRHASTGTVKSAGTKISRLASLGVIGIRCRGFQIHRDSKGRNKIVMRK